MQRNARPKPISGSLIRSPGLRSVQSMPTSIFQGEVRYQDVGLCRAARHTPLCRFGVLDYIAGCGMAHDAFVAAVDSCPAARTGPEKKLFAAKLLLASAVTSLPRSAPTTKSARRWFSLPAFPRERRAHLRGGLREPRLLVPRGLSSGLIGEA